MKRLIALLPLAPVVASAACIPSELCMVSRVFTGAPEPFAPGLGCDVLNCQTLNFRGGGIVTTFLVRAPGGQTVVDSQTFTFNAPEPSATSLLLIGFAGLAALRWRGRQAVEI